MSIWNKRLSEVTFDDLDQFCRAGHAEGVQLDYKQAIPRDLEKSIAAFANTRGGLLILGVAGDQTTNRPIWPFEGMARNAGYTEQIAQRCRDNIYPPVLPEFSNILVNPQSPDHVYLVARVHESPSAPHTISNRTEVYVRRNDLRECFALAQIDRIEALLARRHRIEKDRESLIDRFLSRSVAQYGADEPFTWWGCLPEYPDRDLCTLEASQGGIDSVSPMRAPDGYFGQARTRAGDHIWSSVGRRGDMFYGQAYNLQRLNALPGKFIAKRTLEFLNHCQHFYRGDQIAFPGLLRFTIGCRNVQGRRMEGFHGRADAAFPDIEYRIDRTLSLADISDDGERCRSAYEIVSEVFHAFDLPQPNPVGHWQ